ncbi:MAG: methyltransferase domain-containing protein [Pseudomonadota bacterium]
MSEVIEHIQAMYQGHPISAAHILQKIGPGPHAPEDLWPHDQDHYGGLEANARIADRAGLAPGMRVADFCAGLGGPARWYAHVHDVDVTGVDLTPERVEGAAELTRAAGLSDRVRVLNGSITDAPLPDGTYDAVVSQEAFLHIADYPLAVAEAYRVLKPGGRAVVTSLTAPIPLPDEDALLLRRGIGLFVAPSSERWAEVFSGAGFGTIETEDLSAEWAEVLRERLAMYMALREETEAAGTPTGDTWFHRAYPRFVELITAGGLGGILIKGTRPGD